MSEVQRRRFAVQRILGEIQSGVDRGDRVATMIHIHEALRRGDITERDADRLVDFLLAIVGDKVTPIATPMRA